MLEILASEPLVTETTALAWWGAWTVLLVSLVVFNLGAYA